MANSIKPNRNDLAKFLPDQRLIRAFEQLFDYVPAEIDANAIDSYNSQASAQQALDTVEALRSVIELASTAPAQQANQIAELAQQVALLSQAPPVEQRKAPRYGTFYDTTTQTAAAINTAYAVTFNSTDLSFGVSTGTPTSRIYVDSEGIYNFQFSLLGLNGLVFKSHGSADAMAFEHALNRAYDAARNNLLERVRSRIAAAAPLLLAAQSDVVTTAP